MGFLRPKYAQKQIIVASTDKSRTYSTAKAFFQGLYPLTSTELPEDPLSLSKQLYNPLKGT